MLKIAKRKCNGCRSCWLLRFLGITEYFLLAKNMIRVFVQQRRFILKTFFLKQSWYAYTEFIPLHCPVVWLTIRRTARIACNYLNWLEDLLWRNYCAKGDLQSSLFKTIKGGSFKVDKNIMTVHSNTIAKTIGMQEFHPWTCTLLRALADGSKGSENPMKHFELVWWFGVKELQLTCKEISRRLYCSYVHNLKTGIWRLAAKIRFLYGWRRRLKDVSFQVEKTSWQRPETFLRNFGSECA